MNGVWIYLKTERKIFHCATRWQCSILRSDYGDQWRERVVLSWLCSLNAKYCVHITKSICDKVHSHVHMILFTLAYYFILWSETRARHQECVSHRIIIFINLFLNFFIPFFTDINSIFNLMYEMIIIKKLRSINLESMWISTREW